MTKTRPISHWLERHRRGLIAGYLGLLALACAIVIVPRLRAAVTGTAADGYERLQDRWSDRVAAAEALLAAGDSSAVAAFAELDATLPARTNRHALDRERERVLRGLGAAHLAAGRKGRALDAYRRAVVFDPRNVENHHALALAALALDEADEAETHFRHAVDLYPAHGGATRALIEIRYEAGDYAGVVKLAETYLEAFRIHPFLVVGGERRWITRIPVDGRDHTLRIALPAGEAPDTLELRSAYPTLRVREIGWRGAAGAATPGVPRGTATNVSDEDWRRIALDPRARVVLVVARAGIPIDAATLQRIETAYRNLLRFDRIAEVRGRFDVVEPGIWDGARVEAP